MVWRISWWGAKSFLFSLYLLSRYGGEVRPGSFYVEGYLQAFPMVLEEVEPTPYSPPEETLRRCYMLRTFERFAAFGLATVEREEQNNFLAPNLIIGKTPLLGEVVKFASVPAGQD